MCLTHSTLTVAQSAVPNTKGLADQAMLRECQSALNQISGQRAFSRSRRQQLSMERPAATPLNKFFCQSHAGGEGYEAYTGKEQQFEAHEAEKPNYGGH